MPKKFAEEIEVPLEPMFNEQAVQACFGPYEGSDATTLGEARDLIVHLTE